MSKLKQLWSDESGYNMIEMISVIVIIALLAAIIIPGMVSMIDDAKKQANVSTARYLYLAAQIEADKIAASATAEKPYHIPTATDIKPDIEDDNLFEGITSLTIYDNDMNATIDGISFVKDGDTVELLPGDKVRINGQDNPITTPALAH